MRNARQRERSSGSPAKKVQADYRDLFSRIVCLVPALIELG